MPGGQPISSQLFAGQTKHGRACLRVKPESKSREAIENWGDLGKVLLPDLLHVPRGMFVVGFAVALIALLMLLQRLTTR